MRSRVGCNGRARFVVWVMQVCADVLRQLTKAGSFWAGDPIAGSRPPDYGETVNWQALDACVEVWLSCNIEATKP